MSCSLVTRFIRKLRGGSQPALIQADDGLLYVAKFANNLQGPNLLFNEAMGAELYRICGLSVPSWKPLQLTDDFLDRQPETWIEKEQGLLRPSAGLCFGSLYLGAARAHVYEILPASSFYRIRSRTNFWLSWLLDVSADHADNRQALFLENVVGRLSPCFIDHGHLFGGPTGDRKTHYLGSRYLDSRIYPQLFSKESLAVVEALHSVGEQAVRGRLAAVPDEWKLPSALQGFEACMNRLANRMLLESLLDTIVDSVTRKNEHDGVAERYAHSTRTAILYPGIQLPDATSGFALG